jgi:general secretion pathway protein F
VPLYAYKGIGPNGKSVSGVKDADTPKGLRQALRKDGVLVTEVELSRSAKKGAAGAKKQSLLKREVRFGDFGGGVKKTEVTAFTRQLATLINAGIPLAESLGALFEQLDNVKLKTIVEEVRSAVNEGGSLADSLAKHPEAFNDLFVSMVRSGETAGNLDQVLVRLADFQESSAKLKSKVTSAMVYPVIMVIVMTVIMAVLMVGVVPRITALFDTQEQSLPLNTQLLIVVADLTGSYWWAMLLLAAGAGVGFRKWTRTEKGRRKWHAFQLKMPLFGPILRRVAVERFSRTLGTMLQAGVPMIRSLETAKAVLGNVVLAEVIEKAKVAVTEGESLAVTLQRSGEFPPTVTHMIAVGERAGQLESMLLRVADAYESEVTMKLEKMTSVLEPVMLVVMGGAVAFVVFSILMPIMEMSSFPQ